MVRIYKATMLLAFSAYALTRFGVLDDALALVKPAEPQGYMSSSSPWAKDYKPKPALPFVHYRNCDAARAARVAPIRRGEPGYSGHLDRDGDGVACEPWRGRR